MYSSNQRLDITCSFKNLAQTLDFVVHLSGEYECMTREKQRVKPAFRITENGLYLLRTGSMPADPTRPGTGHGCQKDWIDYPFDYDSEIIARIIQQWAQAQPVEPIYTDGAVEQGIWIQHPNNLLREERLKLEIDQNISLLHVIAVIQPISLAYCK